MAARLRSPFALEEHAIELRLDLRNSLELQMKLFEYAIELMSQFHDFLNLPLPNRAVFTAGPYGALVTNRPSWPLPASDFIRISVAGGRG